MKTRAFVVIWVFAAVSCVGVGAHVFAQTPYYQGKTIRLIQGREARRLGRHTVQSGHTISSETYSGKSEHRQRVHAGRRRAQGRQLHF